MLRGVNNVRRRTSEPLPHARNVAPMMCDSPDRVRQLAFTEEIAMPVTKEDIIRQLRTVQDPELFKDLVTLNMVKKVAYCDGIVDLNIELTTPACPLKDKIKADIESAVRQLGPEI